MSLACGGQVNHAGGFVVLTSDVLLMQSPLQSPTSKTTVMFHLFKRN